MTATLILTLISAISGSLTGLLGSEGVISSGISNLINASVAAGVSLFNALKGGGTATNELQAVLTTLQAEYTAIKNDTSANPTVLGAISEVSLLVDDALTGFTNASSGGIDPSTLPVPPAVE